MGLHFEGVVSIKAPPDRVWSFLIDPHAISRCMPDVQSLTVTGDGKFRATVRVGVSFIRGNFAFDVAMTDLNSPQHARIMGRGGGLGSAVDIDSTVDLVDGQDGTTTLNWKADVIVSGTIASVGARLLNTTVEKKTGELFECVKAQLEA